MELLCVESHSNGQLLAGYAYEGEYSKPCDCECFNVGHKNNVGSNSIYINVGDTVKCITCGMFFIHDGYQHYRVTRFAKIATESEMEGYKQEKELSISK